MKFAVLSLLAMETSGLELRHHANPIRKVVNMLQMMQKKVEAEGAKEKELHEKYMCYCNSGAAALDKSVEEYSDKIPVLQAAIKDAQERNAQIKTEVEGHTSDRAEAKKAMAEATGVREREAAAYKAEKEEGEKELSQLQRALKALMGGGAFLQTGLAQTLKQLILARESMDAADRDDALAFLSDGEAPAGGTAEIIGIIKQMIAETEKELAEAKASEDGSVRTFDGLIKAKTQEVEAATKMIETKLVRSGDLDVEIATNQNDLADVEEALGDDQKFLVDLKKNCAGAGELYEENVKVRTQELTAIADTIKLLNDDDALELFKKTLPGPATSFLQVEVTSAEVRRRALEVLRSGARESRTHPVEVDFIALSLDGRKLGFDKIIGHIDKLVAELGKEQQDDDDKKEYCTVKMDAFDDKKKALEREIKDLGTSMTDAKEQIQKLGEECAGLEDGIKSLDKQVAEGTEQRKEEASDFLARQTSDNAAKQLLEFAKNRLNKFYNPKQYKPEAQAGEALFLQRGRGAPPPPPQAVAAYKKKGEESQGVIQMINVLIADLEKDMAEAEVTEKDAQADYEAMLQDASEKRIADVKTLEEKSDARTQLIAALEDYTGSKSIAEKTLGATEQAISNLHGECDFLLKYFDVRKEARANEVDALQKCKAVLNGADY